MGLGMNVWGILTSLAGGLGLFLLGMTMMTDGLRLAAGPALERILSWASRTRWHALGSGVLVTALVQSSSAVTVAAIGFVNAGLLGLAPALWVLFGANVGTTMTGWIVALVGLKFKIEALALPLIGLGVGMRLTGQNRRHGPVGSALAGFGLLFLGLSVLQSAFADVAGQITLPRGEGAWTVVALVGVGSLMTVLMQSSSASMAIALTAAQSGLLTPQDAAAVVIGANVGTTVTALLATIGATPNARRAAAAHVIFNVLTGAVALALLPWLIDALATARQWMGLQHDPAARLALFHTVFNLLGVALMWPLATPLTHWLQQRFRAREEDEAQPQYLDANILQVPSLAVEALSREVARIGHVAVRMARGALAGARSDVLSRDQLIVSSLGDAAQTFTDRMGRSAMTQSASEHLAQVLRVQRYYETTAEQAHLAAQLQSPGAGEAAAAPQHALFVQRSDALLALCDPLPGPPDPVAVEAAEISMEAAYDPLKVALLAAGASGALRLVAMEEALRRYSALRRAAQQAAKAVHRNPVPPAVAPAP